MTWGAFFRTWTRGEGSRRSRGPSRSSRRTSLSGSAPTRSSELLQINKRRPLERAGVALEIEGAKPALFEREGGALLRERGRSLPS